MLERAMTATAALGAALTLGACGNEAPTSTAPEAALPQGAEPYKLNPADFTTEIDNPYFPLAPGSRWVYEETDLDGAEVEVEVVVTNETKQIANGIEAVVVRDTATEGGEPVEVTDDWYAQDADGNVWYLGEDTAEYENGKVSTRAGSFEAGVDGAQAGVAMPANPTDGMAYRQEYYASEAEDRAEVLSTDELAEVPFGFFRDVLLTKDLVPTEPKVTELKLYAKGIGLVEAVDTAGGTERAELIEFTPGK